ncbi:MAG: 3-hydroxyacyl-CoA dehydrogenase family protein [bacterium]
MNYEQVLENVSVLGAAGKMGSGILLLTAVEMTDLKIKTRNTNYKLNAIDVSENALTGVLKYVETQARKIAEKKIDFIKEHSPDENDEGKLIEKYVSEVLSIINISTKMESAASSKIIFEAVNENPELKINLFTKIERMNNCNPWYFTNTSSVPIGYLDDKAVLNGRIIGFHFYNPPAVQKLVELITCPSTKPEIHEFAMQLAKKLKKTVVPSNDVAGFIGNGHFMRDALFALNEVEGLHRELSFAESVFIINKISQEYLIRPMGIFQLIDYVGIDVVLFILKVMNPYMPDENLESTLLDKFIKLGIKGGQNPDGSQRDGIMKYEKGQPISIYDFSGENYQPISEIREKCDSLLGNTPSKIQTWKNVIKADDRDKILREYFNELENLNTPGGELARKYCAYSRKIALKLVHDKVANNEEDVNTILKTGFFHAYGPINNYMDRSNIS